jgi:haloacetate dehalogenase
MLCIGRGGRAEWRPECRRREAAMTELSDLFPGFASHWIDAAAGRIFARSGGSGPPLVLLHGFPETHVMWHKVAPALAAHFTLVAMDLRGYGWSSAPRSHGGELYAKRAMGEDVVAVMEALGHVRFHCAGHDRGARVAYRLALDHPGRIDRLALLDIVPTFEMWKLVRTAGLAPHWTFLALPEPQPEAEIGKNPDAYFDNLLGLWTGSKDLRGFDARAVGQYRAAWGDPTHIHAMCEDYRAGATFDVAADEADMAARKTIASPVHIVCGAGFLTGPEKPLAIWRRTFAPNATGATLPCGHFVAEEDAPGTQAELLQFFRAV